MFKPSIGRVVHYFTQQTHQQFNGVGIGPYAAIITQVHGEGNDPYVTVTVFPPFAAPYTQGSIRQMTNDGQLFPIGAMMGYAPPPRV